MIAAWGNPMNISLVSLNDVQNNIMRTFDGHPLDDEADV